VKKEHRTLFTGKYITKTSTFSLTDNAKEISSEKFEFATKNTSVIATQLNCIAFKNKQWNDSFNNKHKRNLSHINKNCLSMMLIKSIYPNRYIGFTHIFPVSKNTWHQYLRGFISDSNLTGRKIISSNKSKVSPFGLIIFSVASAGIHSEFKKAPSYSAAMGKLLEQALFFHLKTIIMHHFNDYKSVPIMFQNDETDFLAYFDVGRYRFNKLTKDNKKIIRFNITNI
jgi:hypothetical protein